MNLKDKCAEDGITIAEGKEKYGLTHWNATVPDAVETESQEDPVEELVEAVVKTVTKPVETKSKISVADARAIRGALGDKDRGFLRVVRENKDSLPEEYKRVKPLIDRYL